MLVATTAALPKLCGTIIGAWVVQLFPSNRSFTSVYSRVASLKPVMAYRLEPTTAVTGHRRASNMGDSFRHEGVQVGVPVGVGVGVGGGNCAQYLPPLLK